MTMVADVVDAVVGVDTHRDTHTAEIASPTASVIATTVISNSSAGYAELIDWIAQHAPGPRLIVAVEGTRSYGVGLARALTAAGMLVIECEQPARGSRRGKGKSDPIDAHLAVLTALRLDTDRLPMPRADGDREALRILLTARDELTAINTAQTNRLRALLLAGDDADRELARSRLGAARLAGLIRRRLPRDAIAHTRCVTPRSAALRWHCGIQAKSYGPTARSWQASSRTSFQGLLASLASDRSALLKSSFPSPTRDAAATKQLSPPSVESAHCKPAADGPCDTASTAAATARSTRPSTPSPRLACATARKHKPTSRDVSRRASAPQRSDAV
jgi:hypothetical protein